MERCTHSIVFPFSRCALWQAFVFTPLYSLSMLYLCKKWRKNCEEVCSAASELVYIQVFFFFGENLDQYLYLFMLTQHSLALLMLNITYLHFRCVFILHARQSDSQQRSGSAAEVWCSWAAVCDLDPWCRACPASSPFSPPSQSHRMLSLHSHQAQHPEKQTRYKRATSRPLALQVCEH